MEKIYGFFNNKEEQDELKRLVSMHNVPGSIGIEIGSFYGLSSCLIAKNFNNGTLYCLDKWNLIIDKPRFNQGKKITNALDIFRENTKHFSNIIAIKGTSPYCVQDWSTPVDFVFLDASHRNPNDLDNIIFWWKHIKLGGKIIGHDYDIHWPDVIKNVNFISKKTNIKPVIINTLWSFTVVDKLQL